MTSLLRRFAHDTGAVSAVEFAVLLPVLLLLLLGSFDIARAIDVKTKTTLLSRTVSDFVSQNESITPADLASIVQASRSVLYPYPADPSLLTVSIESIRTDPNDADEYIIDWSYAPANQSNRPSTFDPPVPTVVRTTVNYTYNLKFSGFLVERLGFDKLALNSTTYMAPRWGTPVEASNF
jgi:Flp pilus assembly protein TadG